MNELKKLIADLHKEKYPEADVIFLAGSVIRSEATKTSDLDIVVLYESLQAAYRESYYYGGWPVEAFVHDPETLQYFFHKVDVPTGIPSLPAMVSEGVELPNPTKLSREMKQLAEDTLQAGPVPWDINDINNSRYMISDLVEDIKEPRSLYEVYGIASQLYAAIANHYWRRNGFWSAKGKTIPRQLEKNDEVFAMQFNQAFHAVYCQGETQLLVALAQDLLAKDGGFLFEGYRLTASEEWR